MRMNTIQRRIILVGLAVIVLMGLFPPWLLVYDAEAGHSEQSTGYRFIVWPGLRQYRDSPFWTVQIDLPKLFVQWAVVVAATGFGVLLTAKREDGPKA
jgi:hypothetical protein